MTGAEVVDAVDVPQPEDECDEVTTAEVVAGIVECVAGTVELVTVDEWQLLVNNEVGG